jgi:hypothetical protein
MNRAEHAATIALCADLAMRRQWAPIGLARCGVYSAGPEEFGADAVDRRAVSGDAVCRPAPATAGHSRRMTVEW